MEQLQCHKWLTASSYMGKYLRIFSYVWKPFLIYDFATAPLWISLYIWGKFDYLFIRAVDSPRDFLFQCSKSIYGLEVYSNRHCIILCRWHFVNENIGLYVLWFHKCSHTWSWFLRWLRLWGYDFGAHWVNGKIYKLRISRPIRISPQKFFSTKSIEFTQKNEKKSHACIPLQRRNRFLSSSVLQFISTNYVISFSFTNMCSNMRP